MTRLPFAILTLALLLVPGLAAPASSAPADGAASQPYPMFARPKPLNVIEADPWLGALWLGSSIGLIRLENGAPPQQVSFRQGLPGMTVYDVFVTPDRVWVGTNAGPAVYDKGDGSVRRILDPDGQPMVEEARTVFAEPDAVWVGTTSKGLFRVDPGTLRATAVNNPVDQNPFTQPVMGLGVDGQEMFISVTGYGLVQWHRDTGVAVQHKMHLLHKDSPLYGRLLVTPPRVWVGTSGDGVVYLDRSIGMMGQSATPRTVNSLNVGGLVALGDETWMATDSGMSRHDGATDTWRNWQNFPWGNANDLAVLAGNVVAAMKSGTVILYNRLHDRWVEIPWWTDETAPTYNTVSSCDEADGRLLFGTGGGGAILYDPGTHTWQRVGSPAGKPPDILIWDTAQDVQSTERTWIATQRGAALWDRAQDSWDYYRTDGREMNHIVGDPIRQVAPSADGAWFAVKSYLPPKIHRIDWQPGRLAHWEASTGHWSTYQSADGLANDNVTAVALSPGKVWVGMQGGGLDVLDVASDRISHIYPVDGAFVTVRELLIQDNTLWIGTVQGLLRMNLDDYLVTPVSGTEDRPVQSLAWVDGKLWVGTSGRGLYSLDPATGARVDYVAPSVVDTWVYCILPFQGLLFLGTGNGVERLDPATGKWLPQMGLNVLDGQAPARLTINTPVNDAVVAAGPLRVEGVASGPADAAIQVRLAGGKWQTAEGFSTWQTELQLPNRTGEWVVQARIQVGRVTYAQTARVVEVPGAVRAIHTPILQANEDQEIDFQVVINEGNATGEVVLTLPEAAEPVRIPLRPDEVGALVARSPPLTPSGTATYRIELRWADGATAVFPDPNAGQGTEYVLEVLYAGELHAFASGARCPPTLNPGAAGEVALVVQNTGARPATLSLQLSGPAAAWVTPPPPTPVAEAASWDATFPMVVPRDAAKGTYGLDGQVLAGEQVLESFSCTVRVAGGGLLGIPGLGIPVLFVGLALAGVLGRRRFEGP